MSISLAQLATLTRAGTPSAVIEALSYEDSYAALLECTTAELELAHAVSSSLYEAQQYSFISDALESARLAYAEALFENGNYAE
jgi:16S rRNA G966 N2-methylase RsmD